MITSTQQLLAAKKKKKLLLESGSKDAASSIELLEADISEYHRKSVGPFSSECIQSLKELLAIPVHFRLANKMTLEDFAKLAGVSSRQVQRYEEKGYQNCSTGTFNNIIHNLDLRVVGNVSTGSELPYLSEDNKTSTDVLIAIRNTLAERFLLMDSAGKDSYMSTVSQRVDGKSTRLCYFRQIANVDLDSPYACYRPVDLAVEFDVSSEGSVRGKVFVPKKEPEWAQKSIDKAMNVFESMGHRVEISRKLLGDIVYTITFCDHVCEETVKNIELTFHALRFKPAGILDDLDALSANQRFIKENAVSVLG